MRREETVDWEVYTAADVKVGTFSDEELARKWVFDRRGELPGAYVAKYLKVETWERAYRPRLKVVAA